MAKTSQKSIKSFGEKRAEQYEKDRFKLEAGIKFIIRGIPEIKELTDFSVVLINGEDIQGNPVKYYATGKAIVNQCKELLNDANAFGVLNEPILVETITKKATMSKFSYVAFSSEIPDTT